MSANDSAGKRTQKPTERKAPGWFLVTEHVKAGRIIVGIDEVGRGAWAGPVAAAAVVLPPRLRISGLADSKLLTPPERQRLDLIIRRRALGVGLGWASNAEVDRYGLSWAVKQCGLRALAGLNLPFDVVVLDGKFNHFKDQAGFASETWVKADQHVASVAAASVVAKVARDRYLERLDAVHAGYGFASHKGYAAPRHRQALRDLGPSPAHRTSWRPFRQDDSA